MTRCYLNNSIPVTGFVKIRKVFSQWKRNFLGDNRMLVLDNMIMNLTTRVNGQISDRAEIRTPNFQLQYLLQLYSKNLTIGLEPFTGTL